jgi:excisionase family DNA binding protein
VPFGEEDFRLDYNKGIIKETEFFTTAELAQKLKMNVQVITRKIQAGDIFAYKIGKDWRIPEFSVFQWLESNANDKSKRAKKSNGSGRSSEKEAKPSPRRTNRKYLLEYILAQFEPNRDYSEDEVNRTISRYHEDYGTVRQEFLAEEMMEKVNGHFRRRAGYQFSD